MAPIRAREKQEASLGRGRKRRKVADPTQARKATFDQLPWKEVPFLDQFEDAGGFFGLEEISDVEVTRIKYPGKIQYKLKPDYVAAKQEASKKHLRDHDVQGNCAQQAHPKDNEEWEGFGEDPDPSQRSPIYGTTQEEVLRGKKHSAQKRKLKKKLEGTNGSSGNSYKALEQAGSEDGDTSAWHGMGLAEETLASLSRLKFSQPTPIQRAAIPEIVDGHDVIGKASTGSGKTLAFGIPIYEYYLKFKASQQPNASADREKQQYSPIALIISPTRELAHQLSAHLNDLCSNLGNDGPLIAKLTGGLSMHKQQRLLPQATIIICTPGRLWEVMSGDAVFAKGIKRIKFLVMDEADRLLSQGHFKEVDEILNALDRKNGQEETGVEQPTSISSQYQRQTLIFSATFQKDLQLKLAGKGNNQADTQMAKQESMEYLLKRLNFREEKPKFLDMNPISQMATNLTEGIVECAGLEKDLYLYAILLHHAKARTLVFVNSITSVRRLTPFLQNLNLQAHALHSQMPQKARLRSVERFSDPSSPASILIATDVAARGLDIPLVQLILHYHVPRAADMYVHRSGRTARAQNLGSSILLCAPEEVQGVRRLVTKVHTRNASKVVISHKNGFIRSIELDRRIVARLKSRVILSKRISDASLAKEKKGHEDNWLRTAAEDLGVEYDSDDFAAQQGTQKGRGQGRQKREREARGLGKGELGALKFQLREELKNRINVGVSERYLTAGGVDVDGLLEEKEQGQFLGRVNMNDLMT